MTALLLSLEGLRDRAEDVPAAATDEVRKAAVAAYNQLREIQIFRNAKNGTFSKDETGVFIHHLDNNVSLNSIIDGRELWPTRITGKDIETIWPVNSEIARIIYSDTSKATRSFSMATLSLANGALSEPKRSANSTETSCGINKPGYMAFLSTAGELLLLNLDTLNQKSLKLPKALTWHKSDNCDVDWEKSNLMLSIGDMNTAFAIYTPSFSTGKEIDWKSLGNELAFGVLSPTAPKIAVAETIGQAAGGKFTVRDLISGRSSTVQETGPPYTPVYSPGGGMIAIITDNRVIELFDSKGTRMKWPDSRVLNTSDFTNFPSRDFAPLVVPKVALGDDDSDGRSDSLFFGSQSGTFFSGHPGEESDLLIDDDSVFQFPTEGSSVEHLVLGRGGRLRATTIGPVAVIWSVSAERPAADSSWTRLNLDPGADRETVVKAACSVLSRGLTRKQRDEYLLPDAALPEKVRAPEKKDAMIEPDDLDNSTSAQDYPPPPCSADTKLAPLAVDPLAQ